MATPARKHDAATGTCAECFDVMDTIEDEPGQWAAGGSRAEHGHDPGAHQRLFDLGDDPNVHLQRLLVESSARYGWRASDLAMAFGMADAPQWQHAALRSSLEGERDTEEIG